MCLPLAWLFQFIIVRILMHVIASHVTLCVTASRVTVYHCMCHCMCHCMLCHCVPQVIRVPIDASEVTTPEQDAVKSLVEVCRGLYVTTVMMLYSLHVPHAPSTSLISTYHTPSPPYHMSHPLLVLFLPSPHHTPFYAPHPLLRTTPLLHTTPLFHTTPLHHTPFSASHPFLPHHDPFFAPHPFLCTTHSFFASFSFSCPCRNTKRSCRK